MDEMNAGPAEVVRTRRLMKFMVLGYLFLLVVPAIVLMASTQPSRGSDFRGFLIAGERFLNGAFLYEGSAVASNVTWPPFFAVFIVPFSLLGRINLPMAQVMWYVMNMTLFFAALSIWMRIIGKKKFAWFNESKERSFYSPQIIIPILVVSGPIIDNTMQLQTNIMILFFVSLGVDLIQKKRPLRAGFWFGLAGAIKAFPVLIIIYLMYRKEFRASVSMAVTGILFTMVATARWGIETMATTIRTWIDLSFSGGYPLTSLSQSVYAMIGRYVASNPFERMVRRFPPPPSDDPGIIATTWIYRLLLVAVLIALFWCIHKKKYRNLAVESSFFILVMTVFSPIAWRHYFVLMLPAVMVVTEYWFSQKDRVLRRIAIGAGILFTLLYLIGFCNAYIYGFLSCVISYFTVGAFMIITGLFYIVWKKYGNEPAMLSDMEAVRTSKRI